jgi:hypothetical protein
MKKVLALLSAGVAAAAIMTGTGCGLSQVGAPTVTIDTIGALSKGTNDTVTGRVKADTLIDSIAYSIITGAGAAVPVNQIWVEGPALNPDDQQIDFNTRPIIIHVTSNAVTGSYKLKIFVNAGLYTEKTFDFSVS